MCKWDEEFEDEFEEEEDDIEASIQEHIEEAIREEEASWRSRGRIVNVDSPWQLYGEWSNDWSIH